jgi:integrase
LSPPTSPASPTAAARPARSVAGPPRSATGHEPPTGSEAVKAVLRGIRRTIGSAKQGKAPATADVLKQMLALCPDTLAGKRDRALLALGFAGAFRRSELCALEVADLTEVPDGLRILIRRSKGDQEGQGQEVAIPRGYKLRPVEAVQTWLAAAEISTGPVFRAVGRGGRVSCAALADDSAARIVKRARRSGWILRPMPGIACGRGS